MAPNLGVRNSVTTPKTKQLTVPNTSFNGNANLYSSIMGKNTKRSIAISSNQTSSIKFNARRAGKRMATEGDHRVSICPSTIMTNDSGVSGAKLAMSTSRVDKKPAINMSIAGSSV